MSNVDTLRQILSNDLAAKWINLSDYALDKLSDNSAIKAIMDDVDKYGYGELGLVGQVPILSADDGNIIVSADSADTPYHAFDGNDSTEWAAKANTANCYLGYHFSTPKVIKEITFNTHNNNAASSITSFKLQGSNNGNDWNDIESFTVDARTSAQNRYGSVKTDNTVAYSYWRIISPDVLYTPRAYGLAFKSLQFLAYEPLGNVPIMTASNAPYGEAISDSTYSTHYPWYCFDGVDDSVNNYWQSAADNNPHYIGYKSVTPIIVRKVTMINMWDSGRNGYYAGAFKVQGSNTGNSDDWHDIYSGTMDVSTRVANDKFEYEFDNDTPYLYNVVLISTTIHSSGYKGLVSLQFYGREDNTGSVANSSVSSISVSDGSGASTSSVLKPNSDFKFNSGSSHSMTFTLSRAMAIKKVTGRIAHDQGSGYTYNATNFTLSGSNDGSTWTPLNEPYTQLIKYNWESPYVIDVDSDTKYKYLKFSFGTNMSRSCYFNYIEITEKIDNYSEKEFAQGSTRKTIYDHGVILEELEKESTANGWSVVASGYSIVDKCRFDSNKLFIGHPDSASQQTGIGTKNAIDLSNYNYFGFTHDPLYSYESSAHYCINIRLWPSKNTGGTQLATLITTTGRRYINELIDVSNVNQDTIISLMTHTGGSSTNFFGYGVFKELWLE